MTTHISISRDHSVSMHNVAEAAKRDYNATLNALQLAASESGMDVRLSTVICGSGRGKSVQVEHTPQPISNFKPLNIYETRGGSTPLIDSIIESINLIRVTKPSPDDRFIVMATTDGEENDSYASPTQLKKILDELAATNQWTFIIRVPVGGRKAALKLGFQPDNILEWETNERGQQAAEVATTQAFTNYLRSSETTTTKFFANLKDVPISEVKAKLVDISKEVDFLYVSAPKAGMQIRDFVEDSTNEKLLKGSAFYQLVKSEPKVQESKLIAILEKKSGAIYTGLAARQLLGLPSYGTVRLAPDELGDYEVYVQSTSVNRKVDAGSKIMVWKNVGVHYKGGKSA